MKKLFLLLGIASFLLPGLAAAATMRVDSNVLQSESLNDNLYLVGSSPVLAGTVQGDALVAGGNVVITGYVQEDLLVTAGRVTVTGHVGGDLRIFAGNVEIDGTIDGELFIAGGNVGINAHTLVQGDSTIHGGEVVIAPAAQLLGEQKISSEKSTNSGGDAQGVENWMAKFAQSAFWVAFIVNLIALLLVGVLMFGLYPKFTQNAVNEITTKGHFWQCLGLGFILLIVMPFAAFFSLLSGVGFLLGILLIVAYIGSILVSMVFAGVMLGGLLYQWFQRPKKFQLNWSWIIAGILVLHFLNLIPVIGWAIGFVLFLLAWGALVRVKWQLMRGK